MDKQLFINNRKKIVELMEDNSMFVVFSLPCAEMKFVVNKNYYYVTGDDQVDDIFVLTKNNGSVSERIFIKEYDEMFAKWNGHTYSVEEVKNKTGIENISYLDKFESFLANSCNNIKNIYFDLQRNDLKSIPGFVERFANDLKLKFPFLNILNAANILAKLRTIKDSLEIEKISKAISITNEGIKSILKNLKPGMFEYQAESYFDQSIKYNGATNFAFRTIAASGNNATCLHYSDNNCIMKDGDLVLFDLGAAYENYHADISRTFPINGKFTDRQKQLYNIVLDGQKHAMSHSKPGVTTREINAELIKYYQKALKEIGLITEDSEVSKYYYHGVSHHLGLDTHDMCEQVALVPGCVISCEPGDRKSVV